MKLEKPSSPVPSAGFVPLGGPPLTDETQDELCPEEKILGHHHQEEEESTAVTSSTVNVETTTTTATEVVTSSPEIDLNSDGSTAIELQERLLGIDLPVDVVELIKRLSSENAILRQARITDAREIARLRDLLQIKELQTTCKIENNEDVTNASVADSTESNEKLKDSTILLESKTPESDVVSNESND